MLEVAGYNFDVSAGAVVYVTEARAFETRCVTDILWRWQR